MKGLKVMVLWPQLGRFLILAGIIMIMLGVLVLALGQIGLFRLPGDLEFGSKNLKVYFPIISCVVISVILTAILWIVSYFTR